MECVSFRIGHGIVRPKFPKARSRGPFAFRPLWNSLLRLTSIETPSPDVADPFKDDPLTRFEILDFCSKCGVSYPEMSLAADLLTGHRMLQCEQSSHVKPFFARLRDAWQAARVEWGKVQQKSLRV